MLAKHSLIYLISKIIPSITAVATITIFTRFLTPEEYGEYSLTILTSGFFCAIFLNWVILGVGRYLPDCKNASDLSQLIGTSRFIILTVFIFLLPVFIFLEYFKSKIGTSVLFYLLGFLVFSQSWYDLNLKILNAQLKPVNYGLILGFKSIVAFLLGVYAVTSGYNAVGAIIGLSTALFLATLLGIKKWKNVPWVNFDKKLIRKLWQYGAPLTITFLLVFVIDASDRFFIDSILGTKDLGVYSANYDFTQYSIGTLLAVVHLSAFPLVVNAYTKNGVEGAQKQLQKTFLLVFSVLTPACVGLAATAKDVSNVILGASFISESAALIPLLSLALFFSCIKSFYFDYAFQLTSSTRMQMFITAAAAITNLILNLVLIPVYGLKGAAIATAISFFLSLVGSWFYGNKVFEMPCMPWADIFKVLIAVTIMYFLITNIYFDSFLYQLLVKVFLGIIIFFGFLFFTNFMNIRDLFILKIKKDSK